ncbi:MAG TPA: PEGA domain-containing protein [Sumerlaeia bacterium]|nr:PEGA domain-containing protein [Sumerlaeia bacterium]
MQRGWRLAIGLSAAVLVLAATGCIRSRVLITSDPPDATVKFQNVERGETPITIPFIWYWYYDIALEREGYEPVQTTERFRSPPWFLFPLDFFAELAPIPIPDTRKRHYVLKPITEP